MTELFATNNQIEAKAGDAQPRLMSETLAEFASSLSAGVSGAVTFSVLAASRKNPLAIPAAMMAGGVVKFGVKSGMESAFVDPDQRTAGLADLAWGAVDGLAGVTAGMADRFASRSYLSSLSRRRLGPELSDSVAEATGRQFVSGSAFLGITHALARGAAAGAVGSFTWSVPNRFYEQSKENDSPAHGALHFAGKVFWDTAFGTVLGGGLSGGGTAVLRSWELAGSALARQPTDQLSVRYLHLNDFHSQNDRLAQIKGVSDGLLADAKAKGLPAQFVTAGDMEGTNVQYISEKSGMPENSSLLKMGVRKFIPGNHTYDLGSGFNVPGYAQTMNTLLRAHPDASLIATNLDLSAFPQYEQLAKKFTIDTIAGPNGPEKVATLGLVTREGTELGDVPGIGYRDAKQSAVQTMLSLSKDQGVKRFVILSHLGMEEDQALAKALVADQDLKGNGLKVAAVIGGHSHDFTAAPVWVGKNGVSTGGLSTLRNSINGYEIPIVQAGSHGNWLGQLDLVIRADGAADRFQTLGRMHKITPNLPRDSDLESHILSQTSELAALRETQYNARVINNLSTDNLRTKETALGNLVSDAVDNHVRADAVLTHAGWIRAGLDANVEPNSNRVLKSITREDIANMFKSGGNADLEKEELHVYKIRGDELRNILEFGVRNNAAPQDSALTQQLKDVFARERPPAYDEGHGHFLQVAGIKFDFDLSKAPLTAVESGSTTGNGNRIGKILIRNRDSSEFQPIDPGKEYSIASRRFIFDKWTQFGIFGNRAVERSAVGKSPVEIVGDFINNRTISPSDFAPEGRISNLTPSEKVPPLNITPTIIAPALAETVRRQDS